MLSIGTTKNKNEGRRRFSDEQIRFLEYMFETQSKPELSMKQQLANKLGLHPRQVAIWFQNRRARSKSRQTELEYNNLQQNYDTLVSMSESLKEENQALLNQLQTLRELANTQQGNITTRHDFTSQSSNKELSDNRVGAEIVYGAEECHHHSVELLDELGFPRGVLPLKDLVECGRVRETGFVWMKQKEPYEHFFEGTNTRVSYATEVTAYIEKCKMKKMTGVKSKQLMMWVPIVEMSMENESSSKIYFKVPIGVGKSFPITAFMSDEEKKKYLEQAK